MSGQKPCVRCLIAELDYDEYTQSLLDYIKSVPADRRVSEEEYQRRLGFCRSCGRLLSGMCLECGCYVEVRALKPNAECASAEKRW